MESHSRPARHQGTFADRQEAGRRLAGALLHYRDERPVVLALFRGGVPLGYEIANALEAPLDVLFVRKLRPPGQAELSPGAVADGTAPQHFLDEDVIERLQISQDYLDSELRIQERLVKEQQQRYRAGRLPLTLTGHTVIIVDDGVATGNSVRAGLKAIESGAARQRVLAVPVAPQPAMQALAAEVDDSVCLLLPEDFQSVDYYYADFAPIPDDVILEMLYKGSSPAGEVMPGGGLRWNS